MHHLFVKSAFQPEELNDLKALFDDITGQPWFDKDASAKEAFARHLIRTFPAVSINIARHRSIVEASARMFYSDEQSAA